MDCVELFTFKTERGKLKLLPDVDKDDDEGNNVCIGTMLIIPFL